MNRATVLTFLLVIICTSTSLAATKTLDRVQASVNSSLILLSDVDQFRSAVGLRAQLDPLFAGTSVATKGASATLPEIVDFLINEKVISQQFPVNDQEVEQEINSIQANNKIDRAALKAAIQQQGYKFESYFELIRISTAKRNLIDRDIRTKVTISEDDIKNHFYNSFGKGTAVPLTYKVKIITVSPSSYKTPTAAKEVAINALKSLKSGEAFEEVAKRVSDDPSASTGGDLGTLSEDQMSPVIKEQLKKLKIGNTSDLLGNASSGYFILKLMDIASGESDRFNKMKEEIRGQLLAAEYQHQIQLWLERQKQNSFIHRAGEPSVAGLPRNL